MSKFDVLKRRHRISTGMNGIDSVNQQLHIFYQIQKSRKEILSDLGLQMRLLRMESLGSGELHPVLNDVEIE
uniref:Uncharacterized protein n=1 Tax=Wuchereria bancrofti TaxID=6293 RepID=A0AAF5PKE5_WUCBA